MVDEGETKCKYQYVVCVADIVRFKFGFNLEQHESLVNTVLDKITPFIPHSPCIPS